MSTIAKEEALALHDRLAERHAPNHLCRPDTRLVVEGYPRSSNSFAIDMIVESAIGYLRGSEIGHHTHDVANLKIADAFGIPKVILIREPEAAILSFHIYSRVPIARCAKLYVAFYSDALELMQRTAIVHFREVTGDFRAVIRKINGIGGFGIPEDQDFDAIRDRALDRVRGRSSKTSEEDAMRQVAAPDEKRERIKNELRADVRAYLDAHPEAQAVYDRVIARTGLPA